MAKTSTLMEEPMLAPSGKQQKNTNKKGRKHMNTIQTKDKTHWLAHSKLSCMAAAAALAFSAFQGFAQQVPRPVKNVVLVHGAFADGSSWSKVIPLLEARGLRVTAVQNPLSSLADDVAATRRAIARQDGPVILVGHSWAGMVISKAGNDPKVAGLVYVAALVPDEGQAANDVLKPYTPGPGLAEAKPDASGFLSLTRKGIDEDFVPDLRPAERAIIYATQGAWNSSCLADKVSVPAWTTKHSWFIVAADDRMLPPEYEKAVAEHIHATTTTLAAGHVPMLSSPKQVAAVIIEAAHTPFTALDAAHASAQSVFPANFQTQEIQTDGATIHVRVGGQGRQSCCFTDSEIQAICGRLWLPSLRATTEWSCQTCAAWGFPHIPPVATIKKTSSRYPVRSYSTRYRSCCGRWHDIGATVAYAYAARYPINRPAGGDGCAGAAFHLGTKSCVALRSGISLSAVPMLNGWWLAAKRIYLDRFWNEFAGDPSKIDEATRVHYTAFYAQPGAMHSAFAQFLSIPKDAEDNKVSMTTKLTMPVLAIGAAKMFGANEAIVMRNAADNVTEVVIANSGHWLMEEQPTATIVAVHNFLDRKTTATKSLPGKPLTQLAVKSRM